MSAFTLKPHWKSLAIGLGVTLAIWTVDRVERTRSQVSALTRASLQLSNLVQDLVFMAKEKGEKNPLAWAAHRLSIGQENRPFVFEVVDVLPGTPEEVSEWNGFSEPFRYRKRFLLESSQTVQISIKVPYQGFLGASSPFSGDFRFLVFVSMISLFAYLRYLEKAKPQADPTFKPRVREWIVAARAVLGEHGLAVRNLVRAAKNLTVSASESRQKVILLRNRLATIHEVYRKIQGLKQLQKDPSLENARLGELLELAFSESESALHSFDAVFDSSKSLDQEIRNTTVGMMSQIKMYDDAKDKLAS